MVVGDLINYIVDEVIIYRENSEIDGEYNNIYRGFIYEAPRSVLSLVVRNSGANEKCVVDIRVE